MPPLTEAQLRARERWQGIWNLPILLAAFIPLFVTSPKSRAIEIFVGIGSWLVFVVDLIVQLRIDRHYLRRRNGKIDLAIVVVTTPIYLISGVSGGSAVLLLARLGRVVRVLIATTGLEAVRAAAREGRPDRGWRDHDRVARRVRGGASDEPGLRDRRRRFLVGSRHADDGGLRRHRPEDDRRPSGRGRDHVHGRRRARRAGRLARRPVQAEYRGGGSGGLDRLRTDAPVHEQLAALRARLQTLEHELGAIAERARAEVEH